MSTISNIESTLRTFFMSRMKIDTVGQAVELLRQLSGTEKYRSLRAILENPDIELDLLMVPELQGKAGGVDELRVYLNSKQYFSTAGLGKNDLVAKDVLTILVARAALPSTVTLSCDTPVIFKKAESVMESLLASYVELDKEEDDDNWDDWDDDVEVERPTSGDIDRVMDVIDNLAFRSQDDTYHVRLTDKCKERLLTLLHEEDMVTRV